MVSSLKGLRFLLLFVLCLSIPGISQKVKSQSFKVVPLGIRGGLDESNLSAYLIGVPGSNNYLCADAGTVRYGVERAVRNGVLKGPVSELIKNDIKGYCISHGHLDHLSGLIINSPDDSAKPIYAMPYVVDVLKDKYFSWQSWANFGDQGEVPMLKKYHYEVLREDSEISVAGTDLSIKAFTLSHSSPYQSTAFLIRHGQSYLLYFGDTGADTVEGSNKLLQVWERVASMVKSHALKAIFIEVSYPDEQPEKSLFGHLTPRLLMQELGRLSVLAGKDAMKNLPVVVTHIKPVDDAEARIKAQLRQSNQLGLKLIFPAQGVAMNF